MKSIDDDKIVSELVKERTPEMSTKKMKNIEEKREVLNGGFVRLVDVMGDDSSIVQMARVSYGEGTKTVREDRGLIRYLMRNFHTSPFEGVEFKFHVKAPLFVMAQWHRHRTASLNQQSARYSEMPTDYYIPEESRIQKQSKDNKQGSGEAFTETEARGIRIQMMNSSRNSYEVYQKHLEKGVARELARNSMPVSGYTEMYWKMDLHNLFHFLQLRMDPHAQYEIRVYADAIAEIIKEYVPIAWEAFEDYRLNSITLSRMEIEALGKLLEDAATTLGRRKIVKETGFGKSESIEFAQKLQKLFPNIEIEGKE